MRSYLNKQVCELRREAGSIEELKDKLKKFLPECSDALCALPDHKVAFAMYLTVHEHYCDILARIGKSESSIRQEEHAELLRLKSRAR